MRPRFIAPIIFSLSLAFGALPLAAHAASPIAPIEDGLSSPYPAPEIVGIDQWFNSKPLSMASLKGKVVLIDFWTYSCVNCVRTLRHITAWDAKYRDKGLVIIGVHAPEFDFEKNPANVQAALKKYHINYPVALDNNMSTWNNFSNRYWPAHYLINREGQVVYTHFGEGNYDTTENNIRALLGLGEEATKTDTTTAASTSWFNDQTPETYLGAARADRRANSANADGNYQFPATLAKHQWALNGGWQPGVESITSAQKNAALRIHFSSKKVYLVLGTATGKPIDATLMLNGKPIATRAGIDATGGTVHVASHRLYELVAQPEAQAAVLDIIATQPGLEAYAFTFGD